uniref:ATP synthase F0 subunit 6 n=1 Tax=Argas ricei TaxID=2944766 RepID=UPI0022374017|nr:ATP synthase F0 subunit 6 [Argas ricei]UYB77980.1 ATP synthase F0 subunit 6 [Argas sp. San Antonio ARK-2022a]UYB77993.1 ATP synthase F0 subunit 6 [Argas ricei]
MMNNLFSIFDPSTSSIFSMNWISIFSITFIIPSMYWINPSRIHFYWILISKFLMKELKNNFSKNNMKFLLLFLSVFWFILSMNFLGLYPYIFTPTSHINITSFMALPMWLSFMLFGWIMHFNKMFCHLVPLGTPIFLSSFMVCIETISNIIRPLTLAVRLTANMISGHLLICLLSNILYSYSYMFPLVIPVMLILMLLESAVAMIQSYVFIMLTTLYLSEIN